MNRRELLSLLTKGTAISLAGASIPLGIKIDEFAAIEQAGLSFKYDERSGNLFITNHDDHARNAQVTIFNSDNNYLISISGDDGSYFQHWTKTPPNIGFPKG